MKNTKSRWHTLGWLLVAPLLLTILFIPVNAVLSVCTATPVFEGEDATLSCYFDQDISSLKTDVQVNIFKVDQKIPVLLLSWFNGTAKVSSTPGYQSDGRITDHLNIKILRASRDMAGQYKCIVNPSDVQDSGPCTLYVKGQTGYHERRSVEDTNSGITVLVALGVLSGIITVIFISTLIFGCYKGLFFRRNTEKNEQSIEKCQQFDAASTPLTRDH